MGDEFKIDGDIGIGDLSPGSTGRRYVPDEGERKLRERIHRESKMADEKGLPFSFSKPKKPSRRKVVSCDNCGNISMVNINTVAKICNECKNFSYVTEVYDG